MMNRGAFMVYKCRMCGELHKSFHVPDGMVAAIEMTKGAPFPEHWGGHTPNMVSVHYCKDGNIGVTDFIGCEFDRGVKG